MKHANNIPRCQAAKVARRSTSQRINHAMRARPQGVKAAPSTHMPTHQPALRRGPSRRRTGRLGDHGTRAGQGASWSVNARLSGGMPASTWACLRSGQHAHVLVGMPPDSRALTDHESGSRSFVAPVFFSGGAGVPARQTLSGGQGRPPHREKGRDARTGTAAAERADPRPIAARPLDFPECCNYNYSGGGESMAGTKDNMPAAELIAGECLGVRVRTLNRAVTALYDEALRPHGLRVGQLNLLVAVARMGTARPGDLCRFLRMDKSTLSRDVELMRRNGWLEVDGFGRQASPPVEDLRRGTSPPRSGRPRLAAGPGAGRGDAGGRGDRRPRTGRRSAVEGGGHRTLSVSPHGNIVVYATNWRLRCRLGTL